MSSKDDHIVQQIRSGGKAREDAMKEIVRWNQVKNTITNYVRANSGNAQDAQDMFYEAVVVLDNKIRNGDFKHTGSIKGYVTSCAKYIWMNRLKKVGTEKYFEDISLVSDMAYRPTFVSENPQISWDLVQTHWLQLSEQCRQILKMWTVGYSMADIFEELDISSPAMAKKRKYTCLKKLKSMVFA